jgi:hypothetical protein
VRWLRLEVGVTRGYDGTTVLLRVAASVASSIMSGGSMCYRAGALGAGNDLAAGSYTLEEARVHALGLAGCAGFTFMNPASGAEAPQGKLHVYFKSSADGNDDPTWSTELILEFNAFLPVAYTVDMADLDDPTHPAFCTNTAFYKIGQVYESAYRSAYWVWVYEFKVSMISLAGVLVGQRFQAIDTSVRTILLARMVAWLNSHLVSYVAPVCIGITAAVMGVILSFDIDMDERTTAVVLDFAWLNTWWFCTYIANMYSVEGVVTGAVYLLASYELRDELAVLLAWRPWSPSVRIAMGISNLDRLRVWVSTASGFAMTSKAMAHQCGRRCVLAVSARGDRFVGRMTRCVRESRTSCARGDRGAKIPECPVCFETYGRGRPARILDCGHTVCQGCIAMMLAAMPACDRHHKNVACPSCRVVTAVVHGDASRLVRNFDLESMCIQ